MNKDKRDWLFMAGVAAVIWLWASAFCLTMAVLGQCLPKDLFWYGLSTLASGVTFKTIFDQF
jgi:hypothetical protein